MSGMNKSNDISESSVEGNVKQDGKNQLCKKYKKIKYEIDMQNFKINKLKQDLNAKVTNCFPKECIDDIKKEIKFESCKLDKMIKLAIEEHKRSKDNECIWGSISLNDNLFSKPPQTPSEISCVSGFTDIELLMSENEALEEDRFSLQENILHKDQSICNLQNKISLLRRQMKTMSETNNDLACRLLETKNGSDENKKLKLELEHYIKMAGSLSCNIHNMECYMQELRAEYNCLKRDKEFLDKYDMKPSYQQNCNAADTQNDKVKNIQEQYEILLQEYCKKDKEHKEMTHRLKKCLKNDECEMERAENEALRRESERLISEIEDFKILIKELQAQIDLYRDKFMKAQERVETQKLKIEKLESSKNSIENQVNEEIEIIKGKFQEKLNELCPYPEKYAESRKELEKAKTKIQVLESNLKDVTDELWKCKCELKNLKEQPNDSMVEKYEKLQIELEEQQKKYCGLKKTKECLEDKLCSMKEELEDLRRDSAKIITTTKCTADKNRQILHEQINCLEFELAQCRATASLSLTEKEELIKQLKQELNTLCGHFNGCQGQIQQLKEQIDYLTDQPHYPNFSDDLENWMGKLPMLIRDRIPIINLAIPGSHDSGAYGVTRRSKIAPDAEDIVRELYKFIPFIVRKWAKTQRYTFKEQLYNGIRYFDLRVAKNDDDDEIYFVHGVFCDEVLKPLEEISNFLIEHPGEFVILDCQHFYNFELGHHKKFSQMLLKLFNTRIYEKFIHEADFPYLTLSKALNLQKQLIIIYRNQNIDKTFFQSFHFQNPWPNVTNVQKLEEFLDKRIMLRSPYQGYCTQLVLTPSTSFIIRKFYSSLRNTCAKRVDRQCLDYLEAQQPGPFRDNEDRKSNCFIADFVDLYDNLFPKTVINLNMKLIP